MPVPDGTQRDAGLAFLAGATAGRRTAVFGAAALGWVRFGVTARAVPNGRPCACRGWAGVAMGDALVEATALTASVPETASAVAPMAPTAITATIWRMAAGTTVCGRSPCRNRGRRGRKRGREWGEGGTR